MTPSVQEVLKRWVSKSKGKLVFTNGEGNLIAENHTLERLKRLFPVAGIDASRRLFLHSWRNYFIIQRLEANEPVHRIMQWTGHDSEKMVMHYAKARAMRLEGVVPFKAISSP